jgi:hypothetical protein
VGIAGCHGCGIRLGRTGRLGGILGRRDGRDGEEDQPDGTCGKEVEWSIEGGSPNNLARKGWSRNVMKAGDKITIVIHPLKNGEHGGSLMKVTVNGQTLT